MRSHFALLSMLCALSVGSAGCDLVGPKLSDYGINGRAVELSSVPFFPQEDFNGAPAALATVIAAQQQPVKLDELLREFTDAADNDAFESKILATTRSDGLVPYVLRSQHLDLDVAHEVQAGNPVMVLLNRGFPFAPRWRFVVVAGVDPQRNTFTLRSGQDAHETMSFGEFLHAWSDSGHWAMVALQPEQLPATIDAPSAVAAIAPFDKLGRNDVAEKAYAAVTQRWPDNAAAWEALANARHAQNDFRGSSEALIVTLQLAPQNNVARNNLAYVLLERNCADQAESQINQAIAAETDPRKLDIFKRTRYGVMKHDGPSVVCPGL